MPSASKSARPRIVHRSPSSPSGLSEDVLTAPVVEQQQQQQQPQIGINDLVQIIGQKEIENTILRGQVQDAQRSVGALQSMIKDLRDQIAATGTGKLASEEPN